MDEHFTPLTYAAGIGDAATVADLLVGGADVDEPMTDGLSLTTLLIASRMGHDNVVRLLLEHGASINLALGPSLFVAGPTPLFTWRAVKATRRLRGCCSSAGRRSTRGDTKG